MSLEPTMCVNFVADVDQVKQGLAYSDFPLKQSLRDIMIWREEEILGSGLMAAIANCRRFIVPRRFAVESLYRLVHKREAKRIYLSFPISRAQPKGVAEQVEHFRTQFGSLNKVVVFDPIELTKSRGFWGP